jgi:hypothetical protein
MAGSSGVFFAKAAFETGMISRARLAKDLFENLRFRLVGSTDDRADAVRIRVGEMIAGVPVREMERLAPRCWLGCCHASTRTCSRAPMPTRTPGGVSTS